MIAFRRKSLRIGKFLIRLIFPPLFLWLCHIFLASCASGSRQETQIEAPLPPAPGSAPGEEEGSVPGGAGVRPSSPAGVAGEIRSLTEKGAPRSIQDSLDLIRGRDLGNTEFGRVMNAVNIALLKTVYPSSASRLPQNDPPQTHVYARILKNAESGTYSAPPRSSRDYLELVLPFLALYNETREEKLSPALEYLQRARELNPASVLAPLFLGLIHERSGRLDEAKIEYAKAWDFSSGGADSAMPECYPAAQGLARIMEKNGEGKEAAEYLSGLVVQFPDNFEVKRQLALVYYRNRDWSRAEPAIAEILQRDNRDGEFILYRARVLVEQGQLLQAQAPLDLYAATNNSNNRLYLFLRARVQAEGYRNREAALNYLRSLIRGSQGALVDDEASVYAVRLLMESPRAEDQNEGRDLLRRLLAEPLPSHTVLALALQDSIRRSEWAEARPYLARLLEERRSFQDLLDAYSVEHGQGNNAAALSYARELYEQDRSNPEGLYVYISALIDTGRAAEAASMIDGRLAAMPGGLQKSRFFYLRSRTRGGEDPAMSDLRSSLFEDPRNLDALTAMFEIYHRRRDERRAVYYLKQALAISPDNPRLKRYESEYAASMGGL